MLQCGGELNLLEKPLGTHRGGDVLMQHLERHASLVAYIGGQIDGGHATVPEFTLEGVAIG
jgi:hypothetical protein